MFMIANWGGLEISMDLPVVFFPCGELVTSLWAGEFEDKT